MGDFVHWSGTEFSVNRDFMDKMLENFERTKKASKDKEHIVPIDYNHGSFEYGVDNAKAAGWITELSIKDDGLYAKVRWTQAAADLIKAEEYRFISPEFSVSGRDEYGEEYDGPYLHAAALTNVPFLKGMSPVSLKRRATDTKTSTEGSKMKEQLIKLYALAAEAEEASVLKAVEEDRKVVEEVRALLSLKDGSVVESIKAMSVKLAASEKALEDLRTETKTKEATAKVEKLLASKKIVPADREEWLGLAMENSARFDKLSANLKPVEDDKVHGSGATETEVDKEDIHSVTLALSAEKKIPYAEAYEIVCKTRPELAKKHAEKFGRPIN